MELLQDHFYSILQNFWKLKHKQVVTDVLKAWHLDSGRPFVNKRMNRVEGTDGSHRLHEHEL